MWYLQKGVVTREISRELLMRYLQWGTRVRWVISWLVGEAVPDGDAPLGRKHGLLELLVVQLELDLLERPAALCSVAL